MASSDVLVGNDGSSDSEPEDFQEGVDGYVFRQEREGPAGVPLFAHPATEQDLIKGSHILYLVSKHPYRPVYRSALVVGIGKGCLEIISNGLNGVTKETLNTTSGLQVLKVEYTNCRYSQKKAVHRAKWRLKAGENHYHPLFNNSHFFVTWCKTGKQYPLTEIISNLQYEEGKHYPLKPVLTGAPIQSLADINPGDHLMINSQHRLVESKDGDSSTFTAYTCRKGSVVREEKKFTPQDCSAVRIEYDHQSNSYNPGQALQSALTAFEEKTPFERSNEFVTMMKCGKKYSLDKRCLLASDVEPTSITKIGTHTAIDEGDHLVVRDTFGRLHSILVHSCINEHVIISLPDLNGKGVQGQLDLSHYHDVYRINYTQCLSFEEVLKRACSKEGEEVLQSCKRDTSLFVTWAKVGKQLSVNAEKLMGNHKIAQIRPLQYKKLVSSSEIQVGDHLFVPKLAYRWHFIVTDCDKSAEGVPVYSTIYCLRGSVQETKEKLDPKCDDVFRVQYAEEYPTEVVIGRARSLLGSRKLSLLARLWFVRWAKTGSEEGLEVDFLANESYPVSKSQICCFSQLNPGDYLVKEEKLQVRHHYIVLSVESPTRCSVIESWRAKVEQSVLSLDEGTFYSINYNDGVCISAEESIRMAQEAVGSHLVLKFARRKFVNYLKTSHATEVDVESLYNDGLLLRRERVESALDLKPGDHIECPMQAMTETTYHNMIVTSSVDEHHCKLIHCTEEAHRILGRKGATNLLIEEEVDLTQLGEVFLVKYPEHIDPEIGMSLLKELLSEKLEKKVASENLVLTATLGKPSSIHIDPAVHKILQYAREDAIKPIAMTKNNLPAETTAKASLNAAFKLGTRAALSSTHIGRVAGFGPGVNILAEAPFFTRRVYKLHRQHKFDQISKEDYKRGVIKQSFTSANTVIGATAGALIGQAAIPVPIVGAAVGGTLGAVSGHGLGYLEGWAVSKLVRDSTNVSLPVVESRAFSDF